VENFTTIGLTRPTRRRLYVGLLAFAIATILHMLALLALCDWRQPRTGASQPERVPLIVRLIPPEMSMPSAPVSVRAHNTTMHGTAPRKQSRQISVRREPKEEKARATPADDAGANHPEKQGLDWQADLGSITAHRSIRYGNVPQIAVASSEGSSPQHETAATLTREVSKAARNDCRNAYSHMGLLAIPMLAIDAMNHSGCKW
jgi:hypothetical protein